MNTLSRLLEANGQDPRTFVKDAIFFIVRSIVVILIVLSPICLLTLLLKPSGPPAPAPTPAELPPHFLFFIIPFFLYIFSAVIVAISLLGGWHKLAMRFRAPDRFGEGQAFRVQSARVGVGNYNNILTIRVAPQGLYLACPFPFRLMHPPLLIPWSEITVVRKSNHIFGRVSAVLSIGKPKLATIMLVNKKLLQVAAPWLPQPNQ